MRGLVLATALAAGIVWGLYLVDPAAWPGLVGAWVQTGLLAGNLALTARFPASKVAVVRVGQRWVVNPLVRGLFRIGVNPLGLVLLETTGRRSGQSRVVPVGAGQDGDVLWIVAEHGLRAQYVRNIQQDARVRVRVRRGLHRRWIAGVATLLPKDDPFARQRRIVGWNPLRALNALIVRLLGAELVTVRIDLVSARRPEHLAAAPTPTVRPGAERNIITRSATRIGKDVALGGG